MYVCMYVCMCRNGNTIIKIICICSLLTGIFAGVLAIGAALVAIRACTCIFVCKYVQARVATRAATIARTPANIPVRRLQIVLPFLSYYYTAYYNILVFVYVSCQCHVAAFVCMYVGCICLYDYQKSTR